ncbi:MAG: helix-turn-helix domain-containing protein [Acidimicrobiales bacterium]
MIEDEFRQQLTRLGEFIRDQRRQAELSLRDLAARTNVSNPYLSQIERGLHEPSVRVLKAIALALNVSAETLLAQAGLLDPSPTQAGADPTIPTVDAAIAADPLLSDEQKHALRATYRAFVDETSRDATTPRGGGDASGRRTGGGGAKG